MAINTSQGAGTVITEYDQWRWHTTTQVSAGDILSSNWERQDNQGGYIGSGMSVDTSTGYWTFPRTGIYHIHTQCAAYVNANIGYFSMVIDRTNNGGSSFNNVAAAWQGSNYNIGNPHFMQSSFVVIDVTNVSDVKIAMRMDIPQSLYVFGGTSANYTAITFMRIGDT